MSTSYSSSSSSEYSSESEEMQTQTPSPQQQQQQQQQQISTPNSSVQAQTQMAPHTAVFAAVVSFTPRDLYDSRGRLIDEGKIKLSVAEGTLIRIRCSHESDFNTQQSSNSNNSEVTPLGCHNSMKKKKKKSAKMEERDFGSAKLREHYSDIASRIDIKNITSSWKKAVMIEFPTIRKYKDEGYMGDFVGVFFIPNKLSATKGQNFTACKRMITNGNIDFRTKYPKSTIASLKQDMVEMPNHKYALINYSSPFFMVYNKDSGKVINGPSPGFSDSNQVKMDLQEAREWLGKAEKEISMHMSYGDVTKNFCTIISVPIPPHRQIDHEKFLNNDKTGFQFQGFADKLNMFQGQDISKLDDSFLDHRYEINAEIHVEFYPGH